MHAGGRLVVGLEVGEVGVQERALGWDGVSGTHVGAARRPQGETLTGDPPCGVVSQHEL